MAGAIPLGNPPHLVSTVRAAIHTVGGLVEVGAALVLASALRLSGMALFAVKERGPAKGVR